MPTLFDLPARTEPPALRILPVPFDATTSFRVGCAGGPAAVLEASVQVDLYHPWVDEPHQAGIVLDAAGPWVAELSRTTRQHVEAHRRGEGGHLQAVNEASERVADHVEAWTRSQLASGVIPAVLGGDHSVPLGAIRAALAANPGMGVLHVDAHADLRVAYEGFTQSHASIFDNVMQLEGIGVLAQVGIRDLSTEEAARQIEDARIQVLSDATIAEELADGTPWRALVRQLLAPLPDTVWVSFDIDGLDPSLCPNTGTPVPGGLGWHQVTVLLRMLAESGRRIVGFDLCEVAEHEWDATVGARVLYQLAAATLYTQSEPPS